jgi:predicted porin
MKRTSLGIIGVSALLNTAPLGGANAADIPTKAPPPAAAPATPASCGSLWDFIATACPLTWYGITVYGTVDVGGGWLSHGTPFSGTSPPSQDYLIQKNSNRPLWGGAPNAMSNSNIGIKGTEQIAPGWSFVFAVQAGFNPYSWNLSNGPGSIAQNINVPLTSQNALADSSRAGQFFNDLGYVGVSSPTYGTLTVFRQNSLTLDGVLAYDPMAGSYAFSPIGWQGTTCGVGDTEDCRFSTAVKYRVNVDMFRAAALWQFGGYGQNNASDGAYQGQIGADIKNVANGTLSVDAIYSYVRDAVSMESAQRRRAADSAVHAAVSHRHDLQRHQRDGACQIQPRTAESLWRLRMDSIRAAQRAADLVYQYRGRYHHRARGQQRQSQRPDRHQQHSVHGRVCGGHGLS